MSWTKKCTSDQTRFSQTFVFTSFAASSILEAVSHKHDSWPGSNRACRVNNQVREHQRAQLRKFVQSSKKVRMNAGFLSPVVWDPLLAQIGPEPPYHS